MNPFAVVQWAFMSVAAVAVFQTPPTLSPAPPFTRDRKALIHEVARRSLIELGVSLCIGTAAAFFTATPLQGLLIFTCIGVQTICNSVLRYAGSVAKEDKSCKESDWIASACEYLRPTLFGYLTGMNGQILLHESGHAIAASCVFQNASPSITITPCIGGVTKFNAATLTRVGEKLGKEGSMLLVTLMGPACSLFISSVAIVVGLAVRVKFPELGRYLISYGNGDFYAHSFYALTALGSAPPRSAHDYARLRTYGIHPAAAAIAIFVIPILITRAFEPEQESLKMALGPPKSSPQ